MQKRRALLFFVAGVAWALIPIVAFAQGPLVQCGGIDCNLCDLGQLMKRIINFLIGLSIPIAAAMFAYAGFLYVTGASNPTRIANAHKIFKNVLIGFLIAISAWLVINTILNVVFDKDSFFESGGDWLTLECVSDMGTEPGQRLEGTSFGDLIRSVIPPASPPPQLTTNGSLGVGGANAMCPDGLLYSEMKGSCVDSSGQTVFVPPVNQIALGKCSTAAMSVFGDNAATMSRIAMAESSCNPLACGDNGFSCGMLQINMTANNVICSSQTLPCPTAFSEAYTCKSNGTCTDPEVLNPTLAKQCKEALQYNESCTTNTALDLINNTPRGLKNWSTY